MRTKLSLIATAVLAALLLAGLSRAGTTATVGVTSSVATGGALSVAANGTPSFSVSLTGDDLTKSYTLPVEVIDSRGLASGGGWHLTVDGTQFSDGSGHTLPTGESSITTVTSGCGPNSTCAAVGANSTTYPVAMQSGAAPTAVPFFSTASPGGRGRIDVNATVVVSIPASTFAATYTQTITVAVIGGP